MNYNELFLIVFCGTLGVIVSSFIGVWFEASIIVPFLGLIVGSAIGFGLRKKIKV